MTNPLSSSEVLISFCALGQSARAVAVRRIKPAKASPTFEQMVQERLRRCADTAESARRSIDTSKKLTEESHELLVSLQKRRTKSR